LGDESLGDQTEDLGALPPPAWIVRAAETALQTCRPRRRLPLQFI